MKNLLTPLCFFLLAAGLAFAQETTLKLPTSDNHSSFNVTNSSDNVLLKVSAEGKTGIGTSTPSTALDVNGIVTATQFAGDGSQLANVKSLTANAGGNMDMEVTSYNPYTPTLVKQVSINAPAQGVIIVIVSGYWQWKSENEDYSRSSILSGTLAPNTAAFGTEYFSHLRLSCDYGLANTVDQYSAFSQQRAFTVSTAGTYTYNFYADKGYSTCSVNVADVEMTAVYIPTATVTVSGSLMATQTAVLEDETVIVPGSIDGHSPVSNGNTRPGISQANRIKQLEEKIENLEKWVAGLMAK